MKGWPALPHVTEVRMPQLRGKGKARQKTRTGWCWRTLSPTRKGGVSLNAFAVCGRLVDQSQDKGWATYAFSGTWGVRVGKRISVFGEQGHNPSRIRYGHDRVQARGMVGGEVVSELTSVSSMVVVDEHIRAGCKLLGRAPQLPRSW